MSRIPAIDPAAADARQKPLLDAVQKKLGKTPNMMRVLANSPAALQAYLDFGAALSGGALSAKVREQIALTVGEVNQCDYCLSAHTAIGGMVGLKPEQVAAARSAAAADPKTDAALKLARTLVVNRGHATDQDLAAARAAGLSDAEIVETTANVALNILTNYTNHLAQTVVDFPPVTAAAATR
ncbi:MAG: carboxymuconolactone decarboxylase family protein [Planctomycetota bacterium]